MIKAVVFDLDHTLFDRYQTLTELSKRIHLKLPINPKLTQEEIASYMIKADREKIHYGFEAVQQYLTDKTNLFLKPLNEDDYRNFLLNEFAVTAVPFSFTIPMLKELKKEGFKIGLITNGKSKLQMKKLEMLKLIPYFDKILVSGDYNCPKPQITPFLMMAEWLNLKPCEIMYVGDNPLNDIEGSRNAGYTPVFVNTVGKWSMPEIEECQLKVETVAEIPDLVKKINQAL